MQCMDQIQTRAARARPDLLAARGGGSTCFTVLLDMWVLFAHFIEKKGDRENNNCLVAAILS